jgi:hypothetical protein
VDWVEKRKDGQRFGFYSLVLKDVMEQLLKILETVFFLFHQRNRSACYIFTFVKNEIKQFAKSVEYIYSGLFPYVDVFVLIIYWA